MSGQEKRVDLRFGGFACSLQGFDDPVQPLTRILREMRTSLAERASDMDAPLFDEATLRRLEAEIASASNGGVTAMPGLVLTMNEAAAEEQDPDGIAGEPETAAAQPGPQAGTEPEIAAKEPEAVRAELRAALAGHMQEAQSAADGVNLFAEPDGFDEADEHAAGTNLFADPEVPETAGDDLSATMPSLEADTPEEERPLGWPQAEPEQAHEEPANIVDGDASAVEDASAEPPLSEARAPENIFAPASDDAAAGETAANLFLDDSAPEEALSDEDEDAFGETPTTHGQENVTRLGSYRDLGWLDRGASSAPLDEATSAPRRPGISAADLARKAGASATPDLLAASAAWLTVVKGHGSFTRREVLDVFEELPGDHAKTPEAKIKGFGKLVRNGQVKLGADDRFHLSEAERDRYEDLLG